jgi:hypothetical protein
MSKQLIALNAVLAGVAVLFAVWLARDLGASRPLPPPPAVKPSGAPAAVEEAKEDDAQATDRPNAYNVIVSKYLFSASRSETQVATPAAPPPPPPPPKPMLLGVVVDGPEGSRAYLEDPVSKRVIGYKVGDPVAGGRLERVAQDRVQITGRSDGTIDVLLRDPSKPRPPAPPDQQQPGAAGATPPRVEPQQPQAPGQTRPIPPRAVRRLTPEQREGQQ